MRAAERPAVVGEVAHVGIDVEGAVRRRDPGEARPRQALEHQRPVGAVDREVGVELLGRVQRGEGRHLARVRRADEEILHQPLDPPDVGLGHHHPADPPAGHREVLREGVDDVDLVRDSERRDRPAAVLDAVVDLVRDEGEAALLGPADQRGEVGRATASSPSGSPGSRRGRRRDRPSRSLRHRLVAVLEPGLDADGLEIERLQDVAVARIAGIADRHPVAALEEAGEGEDERRRRARRHHHPARIEVDAVPVAVEPGDPRPQLREAERDGIAERPRRHRRGEGRPRGGGRRRPRLADLHVDDRPAPRLLGPRGLHHVHHNERIDRPAA